MANGLLKSSIYKNNIRKLVWEYDSANYLFEHLEAKQDAETIFEEFCDDTNRTIIIPPSWWGIVNDMLIDLTVNDPNIILEEIKEKDCGLVVEYYPLAMPVPDYISDHTINVAKNLIDDLVQEVVLFAKIDKVEKCFYNMTS